MKASARCAGCGECCELEVPQSIDAQQSPELKSKILDGSLFTWQCPECGKVNLLQYPLLYHDPSEHLIVILSQQPLSAEGLAEGYTGRITSTPGEFIEKIKIFDAGLDDVVVEMVKFVTCSEMKQALDLRFLKMDGSDSDMVFTYPKDGQMQMLSVGFNVYQDCRGIASRNPVIHSSCRGMARVDADWMAGFFK